MLRCVLVVAVVCVLSGVTDVAGPQTGAVSGSDRALSARSGTGDLVVTVAEGPYEPYSIGSYGLRLYAPGDHRVPYESLRQRRGAAARRQRRARCVRRC